MGSPSASLTSRSAPARYAQEGSCPSGGGLAGQCNPPPSGRSGLFRFYSLAEPAELAAHVVLVQREPAGALLVEEGLQQLGQRPVLRKEHLLLGVDGVGPLAQGD